MQLARRSPPPPPLLRVLLLSTLESGVDIPDPGHFVLHFGRHVRFLRPRRVPLRGVFVGQVSPLGLPGPPEVFDLTRRQKKRENANRSEETKGLVFELTGPSLILRDLRTVGFDTNGKTDYNNTPLQHI